MAKGSVGMVNRITGPVVDILFNPDEIPDIFNAIKVNVNDEEETIKEKALSEENVIRHTEGKEIVKVIVIKGKIVNIVVK